MSKIKQKLIDECSMEPWATPISIFCELYYLALLFHHPYSLIFVEMFAKGF
jgi:hypothetical protein